MSAQAIPAEGPAWLLDHAPYTPFMEPRTARAPGLSPLGTRPLVTRDPDHAAQLAERRRLISLSPGSVMACLPEGAAPAAELAASLGLAPGGEDGQGGAHSSTAGARALLALGRATAEDWCLLLPDSASGEYRLVAAVLCFPSRWALAEKIGRPLTAIHDPVPDYDATLARRVNRVFETLQVGRGLWRVNWLLHPTAELYLPKTEADKAPSPAPAESADAPLYLRTERQTITRLPKSGAACFGIKTSVCPVEALSPAEASALERELSRLDPATLAHRSGTELAGRALARLAAIAGAGRTRESASGAPGAAGSAVR